MDAFDEAALAEFLSEEFPNGRLPTVEELLKASESPAEYPLIISYLDRRPALRKFIRECVDGAGERT